MCQLFARNFGLMDLPMTLGLLTKKLQDCRIIASEIPNRTHHVREPQIRRVIGRWMGQASLR